MAALLGAAKWIKQATAQTLEPCQQPKGDQHARPKGALLEFALVIFLGQQGRCKVVVQLEIALKHGTDLGMEGGIRVQAGHLVLVLVGHQLEEVARHRLGQRQPGLASGLVNPAHPIQHRLVALRIGGVLIVGQKQHPTTYQFVKRLAFDKRQHLPGVEQALKGRAIMRGTPAPLKGRLVVVHRHGVELDGPQQRGLRQGYPALLPGIAQHHRVGINTVAQQLGGGQVGAKSAQTSRTNRLCDGADTVLRRVLPVAVFDKLGCRHALGIDRHVGAPRAHAQHGLFGHGHDRVTPNHQIGLGSADPGGTNISLTGSDEHMAPGRAAFLRQPASVLRDDAAPLKVSCHTEQLPDGDHPGAAHAGHHNAPHAAFQRRQGWLGQGLQGVGRSASALGFFLQLPPLNGDKTGAKPLGARVVLVAGALVDLALAAKLGLQGLHAQAVGLHAAVTTALANQRVDHHPLGRVNQRAALAPAALFGGAGLVIDDDRGALDLAKLPLQDIEQVAVRHGHAHGQAAAAGVFFRLVGDDGDTHRTFGVHALRNLQHRVAFGPFAHALPAGHGHCIVVQNLVGDVDPCRNALAHRQHATVKISAVANIGKHVLVMAKGLLADPGHPLAAHLGEAYRGTVHPHRHEVAANAGHGARALRHFGAGVVRTARTKPGLALRLGAHHLQRAVFCIQNCQPGIHARLGWRINTQFFKALGDGTGNQGRRQIGIGAQQGVGRGVRL